MPEAVTSEKDRVVVGLIEKRGTVSIAMVSRRTVDRVSFPTEKENSEDVNLEPCGVAAEILHRVSERCPVDKVAWNSWYA
jgi:hypothetical protein